MATIIKGSKGTAYPNSNKQYLLYAMQITLMHKGLVRELERINRTFLWGSLDGERHCHPISWEVVCLEKKDGTWEYGT